MSSWKKELARLVSNVEERFDQLKYQLLDRLGSNDPLMILPYRTYGVPEKVYLKGRVLEDEGITAPREADDLWDNLLNMYRRFESDEVPHAQVKVRFGSIEREVVADEEGFYETWLEPIHSPATDQLWHPLEVELLKPRPRKQPFVRAQGQALIPPPTAHFGVISDIDDTVVRTDATHLLRMARNVFMGNARTRLPFPGVASFYRTLQGRAMNPIFYVSSSPWNLYDLLADFFQLNGIPAGPILLRDWGITEEELLPTGHRSYKLKWIRNLLDLYVNLPFILIGDSGQEDAEIYSQLVEVYPHRILAIYIRDVGPDEARRAEIRRLAEKVTAAGSTLLLADHTRQMAEHACSLVVW